MPSWRQLHAVVAALLVALAIVPKARASDKEKMPEPEPFGRFTVDQVERRLGQPNIHVYDGNRPETYAENHLPGAVRLYSKDIKEGVLPADKDATLIFYCMNEL